jgi:hypothetical protein
MTDRITFIQFVAEVMQQCQDGLITELEVAQKIAQAADGKYSSVAAPASE